MHVRSRIPALLLLALVTLAAALLIAGFGGPVGIGIVVGMLLGLAAILAFLAMQPRRGGGSSYTFDTLSSNEPDQDLLQRRHRDWMRVAGVDASALRRVIAVGRDVEAGGARVELVAVEIREDGGIATVVAVTRPPVGQAGQFVAASVTDDAGTAFAAAGQGSGGGNVGIGRYDVRFAPAPPTGSRVLTITIESFDSYFPGPVERLEGPWEFRVEL